MIDKPLFSTRACPLFAEVTTAFRDAFGAADVLVIAEGGYEYDPELRLPAWRERREPKNAI